MKRVFVPRERSVLHFNVADFAVAVERVEDRVLRRRPLIIAPQHAARAEVYDMSEEAYAAGVRKKLPLRQALRRCPDALVRSPRPMLYRRAMSAFIRELQSYSPLIEAGREDGHFFVDVTGTHRLFGPAPDIGWRVRRQTRSSLSINPIWTLSTSKLVSKVASRLVKPVGEYIVGPGDEAAFMAPLPVQLLPGVTVREQEKLDELRITTIGLLAELQPRQLMVPFGCRGELLHQMSLGIDETLVQSQETGEGRGRVLELEHLFADDTNERAELLAVIAGQVGQAGQRLRARGLETRRVGIWLRYSDGVQVIRQMSSRHGTAEDFQLNSMACAALERAWIRRTRVRCCRLVCDRLQPRSRQLSLFSMLPGGSALDSLASSAPVASTFREGRSVSHASGMENRQAQRARLQSALDCANQRFGGAVIGLGRRFGQGRGSLSVSTPDRTPDVHPAPTPACSANAAGPVR